MMQKQLNGSRTSCKLWMIEIFGNKELNLPCCCLAIKENQYALSQTRKCSALWVQGNCEKSREKSITDF